MEKKIKDNFRLMLTGIIIVLFVGTAYTVVATTLDDISETSGESVALPKKPRFPQPTYDSGWVTISPAEGVTFTHNLGGNVDNYVVELSFRDLYFLETVPPGHTGRNSYNAFWHELTPTSIRVNHPQTTLPWVFRIRIWVYE